MRLICWIFLAIWGLPSAHGLDLAATSEQKSRRAALPEIPIGEFSSGNLALEALLGQTIEIDTYFPQFFPNRQHLFLMISDADNSYHLVATAGRTRNEMGTYQISSNGNTAVVLELKNDNGNMEQIQFVFSFPYTYTFNDAGREETGGFALRPFTPAILLGKTLRMTFTDKTNLLAGKDDFVVTLGVGQSYRKGYTRGSISPERGYYGFGFSDDQTAALALFDIDRLHDQIINLRFGLINEFNLETSQGIRRGTFTIDPEHEVGIAYQRANGDVFPWILDQTNYVGSKFDSTEVPRQQVPLVGAADFDGNGEMDLLYRNSWGYLFVSLQEDGFFSEIRSLPSYGPLTGQRIVGLGDFDQNGSKDLLLQRQDGSLWLRLLDGLNFIKATPLQNGKPVAGNWRAVAVGDLNGDAKPDILFRHPDGRTALWVMDGTNRVSSIQLRNGYQSVGWRLVGTKDFDNDGHEDILWQNAQGSQALWLMEGVTYLRSEPLLRNKPVPAGWKAITVY